MRHVRRIFLSADNDANSEVPVALIFKKRDKIRKLRKMKAGNLEIPFAEETKYLEVILDRKSLWHRHLKEECRKAISTFWKCRGSLGAR